MFCPNCGKRVDDDKNFCPACGRKLRKPENTAEINRQKPKAKGGFNSVPYLVAAVVIVFIIAAAAVFAAVSLMGEPESESYILSAVENETEKTEGVLEAETEAVTEEVIRPSMEDAPPAAAEPELNPPTINYCPDDSYGYLMATKENVNALIEDFYSYAWVQTTNNHDSSYVAKFSFDNSPIYNMLGLEYWQNKPTSSFKRIYDITVYDVQDVYYADKPTCDTGYDIYVSYTYELYNSETGKISSNIELAVDNINWDMEMDEDFNFSGTLLMNKHTWVNDVPLGTTVTEDDFEKYLN